MSLEERYRISNIRVLDVYSRNKMPEFESRSIDKDDFLAKIKLAEERMDKALWRALFEES